MVPRHTQGAPRGGHVHGQAQYVRNARPTVDQVTQKDDPAPVGMRHPVDRRAGGILLHGHGVAEALEQGAEFVKASVDIANNVEGTVFMAAVGPEPLPLNGDGFHLLRRVEPVDKSEALALEST